MKLLVTTSMLGGCGLLVWLVLRARTTPYNVGLQYQACRG